MWIADTPVKMWGMDSFSGRLVAGLEKLERLNFETVAITFDGAHFSASPKMSHTREEVLFKASLRLR